MEDYYCLLLLCGCRRYPLYCLCVTARVSLQVFSNCSCVGEIGNLTASTGQCLHKDDCDTMFPYFLALSVITSFIISLGGTPGYMLLIRSDLFSDLNACIRFDLFTSQSVSQTQCLPSLPISSLPLFLFYHFIIYR